jgi:hypothetical protein
MFLTGLCAALYQQKPGSSAVVELPAFYLLVR